VPVFAKRLYGLTNQNRAYLKKWLAWLDLVKTFEDTQSFIYTAVHQHSNH
jgi:ribosomal-protein-serine acetyltransferase